MTKKLTREAIKEAYLYLTSSPPTLTATQGLERLINYFEKNDYLEKEPLTFGKIRKECISGETILANAQGYELVYIGFYGEKVVLGNSDSLHKAKEEDISNWRIKK